MNCVNILYIPDNYLILLPYSFQCTLLAGMDPYVKKEKVSFALTNDKDIELVKDDDADIYITTSRGSLSKISFENYHNTWSGIATSKWTESSPNPCKCYK